MASDINWPLVAVELAGGVALLLIGVSEVSRSLKALSGTRLTSVLHRLSGNRVTGALTGAVATALVQSSSVTTVLAVSFVSAGIMAVTQAAAVVVGANLGTTVTAQIVALDITEYSLAIVAAGGLLLVSQFTLAADTGSGMRPGFSTAAAPAEAERIFSRLADTCRENHGAGVETGRFGAHMSVSLVNDGPVTFLLRT